MELLNCYCSHCDEEVSQQNKISNSAKLRGLQVTVSEGLTMMGYTYHIRPVGSPKIFFCGSCKSLLTRFVNNRKLAVEFAEQLVSRASVQNKQMVTLDFGSPLSQPFAQVTQDSPFINYVAPDSSSMPSNVTKRKAMSTQTEEDSLIKRIKTSVDEVSDISCFQSTTSTDDVKPPLGLCDAEKIYVYTHTVPTLDAADEIQVKSETESSSERETFQLPSCPEEEKLPSSPEEEWVPNSAEEEWVPSSQEEETVKVSRNPGKKRRKKKGRKGKIQERNTFKVRTIEKINIGHYGGAIRHLLRNSHVARDDFTQIVMDMVRKDIMHIIEHGQIVKQKFTVETIENFSWHDLLTELANLAPVLHAALVGALANRQKMKNVYHDSDPKNNGILVPGLGSVAMQLLHLRNRQHFKFFQSHNSVLLYKNGNSLQLIETFWQLGISLGKKGSRQAAKRIAREYDEVNERCANPNNESSPLINATDNTVNPDDVSSEGYSDGSGDDDPDDNLTDLPDEDLSSAAE